MCGRYASARPAQDIAAAFGIRDDAVESQIEADYNVAPTKKVYAVVARPERKLTVMRWGLVPSWAKDPAIGNRLINARAETVASKPAFRRAFAARRALLPADGFYEWYDPGRPDKRKQPFFIRRRDGGLLAMAGLYEFWRPDEAAEWLVTCTILTTSAPDEVGRIHDRAPMTVPEESWAEWLDPDRSGDDVVDLLVPGTPGWLEAYPVSTAVNNVRHNGPELLEPIEED